MSPLRNVLDLDEQKDKQDQCHFHSCDLHERVLILEKQYVQAKCFLLQKHEEIKTLRGHAKELTDRVRELEKKWSEAKIIQALTKICVVDPDKKNTFKGVKNGKGTSAFKPHFGQPKGE